MASTLIIDLRHYLDDDGRLSTTMPAPARKFAEYMTLVAEAGTARPPGARWAAAALRCRQKLQRKACSGRLVVMRSEGPAQIEWRCPLCSYQGFLSGFTGTRWDLSSGLHATGRGEVEERVSFDELSALLAAPALGPSAYRVVVGARALDDEAVISVPRPELAAFIGSLAAPENHSRSGTQGKHIDAVRVRMSARLVGTEVRPPIDTSLDPAGVRGYWRIVEMELWARDYLDIDVDAFIEFQRDHIGSFQFGLVRGGIHYAIDRDDRPGLEWSWAGADERDDAAGRGWAVVSGDEMRGRIYIHRGDDSAFVARRATAPKGGAKTSQSTARRRPIVH
jgi:hypothetical protein